MRKALNRLTNARSRKKLEAALPGIGAELKAYSKGSDTTGTQPNTLWIAVSSILKHKPQVILECGTGASTLVLGAAVKKLRSQDSAYQGRIVSMESVAQWHAIAEANLPDTYRDCVEILHGPREVRSYAFLRGYSHSNIPAHNYDFVFLDGPAYDDAHGVACCTDIFRAMELSDAPIMRGVIDGRVSSVFALQQLFGPSVARYFPHMFCSKFEVKSTDLSQPFNSRDFKVTPFGRLSLHKFR